MANLLNQARPIISAPPFSPDALAAPEADDELADEAASAADAEWRALTVPATHHGDRLDRALAALVPEFSRSYLSQLVADGAARLNGAAVAKPAHKLRAGDRLEIELRPTPMSQAFVPQAMPLTVLYEDEHLAVIDKPAGLVVHPAPGHWSGTLLNALLARDARAAQLPRAGIVHRLDKDTSGLLVVARSRATMDALVARIGARQVTREYLALALVAVGADIALRGLQRIGLLRAPRTRASRKAFAPSDAPVSGTAMCPSARRRLKSMALPKVANALHKTSGKFQVMAIERTLSIIKPDAVAKNVIGQIYARFEAAGLKVIAARMAHLSRGEAEAFYAVHKARPFFKDLVDFMVSGPVMIQVLEGENAILKNRDLMGATDPKKAAPGTIRADFADSIDANAVHGSDAAETAAVEIAFFFAGMNVYSR